LVTRLTERHEAGCEHPWQVTDAPEKFIDGQLRAIVGVQLQVTRIEAKTKLSQNRSEADQDGVIAGLGPHPVAEAMIKRSG
jgi:transcriptional regulator